ncbi:unnamed protein product, partial [Phaeothamnion confervicola]
LVLWDFDYTLLADANTDTLVVDKLAPDLAPEWRKMLRAGVSWTECVDRQLAALHARGFRRDDIACAVASVPIQPEMLAAIDVAHAAGATQAIVSDANVVFIGDVLAKHGIADRFSGGCDSNGGGGDSSGGGSDISGGGGGVHSNGAAYTDDGRLTVTPYQPADEPHGCTLCPVNICKGATGDSVRFTS